jgi:hypothetical protein
VEDNDKNVEVDKDGQKAEGDAQDDMLANYMINLAKGKQGQGSSAAAAASQPRSNRKNKKKGRK